jgi:hypothetical protein
MVYLGLDLFGAEACAGGAGVSKRFDAVEGRRADADTHRMSASHKIFAPHGQRLVSNLILNSTAVF